MRWYYLRNALIRGVGSFVLFLTVLVIALILIPWIGVTVVRRTRSTAA